MIILDCEQSSEEWFMARAGIPTASCFDKIITPKTAKPSSQAKNYMYQLAGERITGYKTESYQNFAMQRGIENEAEARELFALSIDAEVQQVGLVYPDEKKLCSCSPDGLMDDIGLEIKCPLIHTHVSYLLADSLPADYICQLQGSMLITGFQAWWFVSYYPGLKPLMIRVPRDDDFCAALESELDSFCKQLDDVTAKLRAL